MIVAPERPAALDDDGLEGAKAAAQYFIALDGYIQATNDVETFEQMTHKSCGYCANRLEQAAALAAAGSIVEGGETSATIHHVYRQDEPTGIWPVEVDVVVRPVHIIDSSGTTLLDDDRVTGRRVLEVARMDGEWVVVGVVDPSDEASS